MVLPSALRHITSRNNASYKFLKALMEPHTRKKRGAFLVEGATIVIEAIDEGRWEIELVALTPEFAETPKGRRLIEKARRRDITTVLMAPALFDEVTTSETPQGVVAAVKQPRWERITSLQPPNQCPIILLEALQDPTNVGAIIRIADAVGAFAVLYTKGTADPYAPKTVRASAGSILHVPTILVQNFTDVYPWLIGHGFQIVATVPKDGQNCFTASLNDRVAFIVGNEARGVSDEVLRLADLSVTIPMPGKANSLNVAVATGILLYEWLRRQKGWKLEAPLLQGKRDNPRFTHQL